MLGAPGDDEAAAAVEAGADLVEITFDGGDGDVAAALAAMPCPAVVTTGSATIAGDAARAGAALVRAANGSDDVLRAAAEAGAAIVADGMAQAEGLLRSYPDQTVIIVEVRVPPGPGTQTGASPFPLLATIEPGPPQRELAAMAVAVTFGCRLLRVPASETGVRAARRVCDTLAAVIGPQP